MAAWSEDECLARRCLAGDQKAWRQLVNAHSPMVYSLCAHRGLSSADADDITQEVMASAFRSLSSYGGCRLSTWLFRIALRRLADFFRSSPPRRIETSSPGSVVLSRAIAPRSNPEDDAVRRDDASRARAALEKLGEPTRSVMQAYYLADMSVKEVSQELDIPANTVKSHLRRGRQALRRHLGEQ